MKEELLKKAIDCLAINDVYIRECHVDTSNDFDPKSPGRDQVDVQFRNGAKSSYILTLENEHDQKVNVLKALYETAFRVVPPDLPEETRNDIEKMEELTLVSVNVLFVADYVLTCDELEKEAIDEFCINNVGYHVWPYWRELAQSLSMRLRLPAVIPPLYQIPKIDGNPVKTTTVQKKPSNHK